MTFAILIAAKLISGCVTDPTLLFLSAAEAIVTIQHADDTAEERLAYLDRRLERLDRWCYKNGEDSACMRAIELRPERDQLASDIEKSKLEQ